MSNSHTWLLEHRKDKYSQTGEDGIIEKILEILPKKDKWCVEFGAWDGQFCTNSRNLIETYDYSAVLIEPDQKKFSDLKNNYIENPNVIPVCKFVGFNQDDNLDTILQDTGIPADFDFLSIDIDGNDYHVWKAVSNYHPKLVVIEFNPTIHTDVKFVQEKNTTVKKGASLSSLVDLGKEKGYELISVLPHNAFFIRKELFPLFRIDNNSPFILRKDTSAITYIFSGYNGEILMQGSKTLPWHGISLKEKKLQQIPEFLRYYPADYSLFKKILFKMLKKLKII